MMIALLFCITNLTFVFLWIVIFFIINSSTDLLQHFNYFKYINLFVILIVTIIHIFVFKLDFDKLFLRFHEGRPFPTLDKIIFSVGIELFSVVFIIGFIYSIYLNLTRQEMSQITSLRLFDIPILILVDYLAFIIEYLSFRYYLSNR